jgi:trehalose 6-phosphate phosphatase
MRTGGPDGALQLAADTLARRPAGLLTDLDGTLAPMAVEASAVRPVPGVADALATLARHLAVVGVVTGRAAADARRVLGPVGDAILVIGNHGLEWLEPGAADAVDSPELRRVRRTVREALARLGEPGEGIVVEDKGISATVHYRRAADPAEAERRALAALEPVAGGTLELRRGRMAIELRPVGLGDKGSAVTRAATRYRLRGLLVAGDDLTDLDMFRAARSLRERGALRSVVIGVGGGHEVPARVAEAADIVLPSPAAVADLLAGLARIVSAGA